MQILLIRLLPFAILFSGITAHATDEGRRSLVLRITSGIFYVDTLETDSAGWDTRIERAEFPDLESANRYIEANGSRARTRFRDVEIPSANGQPIWDAPNAWNAEWERRFAEWMSTEFDADFFVKHNLRTDCADAAIAVRWIFSRMHGLPAGSHLAGSGRLMTNRSLRAAWAALPTSADWRADRRFLASLDYVLDGAYTHVLGLDTYPIAIQPETLAPGAIFLMLGQSSGHTQVVGRINIVDRTMPAVEIFESTVPRAVRRLGRSGFSGAQPDSDRANGFRRHRWVRLAPTSATMVTGVAMPGYSLEQYDPAFVADHGGDFSVAVRRRIRPGYEPTQPEVLAQVLGDLRAKIDERVGIVAAGVAACHPGRCPEGSADYEAHSTPHRDARITEKLDSLYRLGDNWEAAEESYLDPLFTFRNTIAFEILGRPVSYGEILNLIIAGGLSSDPNHSILRRWGLVARDDAEFRIRDEAGCRWVPFHQGASRTNPAMRIYSTNLAELDSDAVTVGEISLVACPEAPGPLYRYHRWDETFYTPSLAEIGAGSLYYLAFQQIAGYAPTAGAVQVDRYLTERGHHFFTLNLATDPGKAPGATYTLEGVGFRLRATSPASAN